MRTHLEFRSESFPRSEVDEESVGNGRWGNLLAEFLARCLEEDGFSVETIPEDWGWAVHVENPAFPLWVGCGNYDEDPDGFLVFIEPSRPWVRRWFKKHDTRQAVESVAASIDKGLGSHPGVRDLRWWSESETEFGKGGTAV